MIIIGRVNLKKVTTQAFDGTLLNIMGTIQLMVQAKSFENLMTFNVMDCPSLCNAILDREWLHGIRKIPLGDNLLPCYPSMKVSNRRLNHKGTKEPMLGGRAHASKRQAHSRAHQVLYVKHHPNYMRLDSIPWVCRVSIMDLIAYCLREDKFMENLSPNDLP
ncbi:hypothetical protein C1H46_037417 [Malus baccata]|uniref:Uncharacterized protein n=1 Tax=Malus baccata TaxID=106549 RepID=A0A540KS38_MALBA|nr:hypothetical protein C1H46_037417 [Malus baccata]